MIKRSGVVIKAIFYTFLIFAMGLVIIALLTSDSNIVRGLTALFLVSFIVIPIVVVLYCCIATVIAAGKRKRRLFK